ncbi:arylsulfatase A-like enzyme [Rhodopirellula rubra]|uniref:Arylsulfatase A-like enzyme n=1 Tax=Aporhodopirellula rubra TaxID=980271 RepID=A0A7W5E3R9_9BACT|nr:arylsulfatase A-like enzyme [Aporhodopirellula rubra]
MKYLSLSIILTCLTMLSVVKATVAVGESDRPNIVFILTDDHRADGWSAAGNELLSTPNLDRIASRGTRFENAFVTLAICSPSRAACLTGRYGSKNGVTAVGIVTINDGAATFADALRDSGYATGVTGKWHLKTKPEQCGFEFISTCWANGPWYDRQFNIDGESKKMPGFVDDVTAAESIRFMQRSVVDEKPFALWMCTQVPHMDHKHTWPAEQKYLDAHDAEAMPLPKTWNDDLSGKPEYLKTSRNRTQALHYGYDSPEKIQGHTRDYYASVEQMDRAIGRVLDEIDRLGVQDDTWILFVGDNGWLLGEHGMTSKVLPYEESMHVPMAIAGPRTMAKVSDALVLNIDLTATIYELAGLPVPKSMDGKSLLPIVENDSPSDWRTSFLYEAPTPQLGSQPLWAVRDDRWKYVETHPDGSADGVFKELYDLQSDAIEQTNLAENPEYSEKVQALSKQLQQQRAGLESNAVQLTARNRMKAPSESGDIRTDILLSGVYPHLTTYGIYSQNGGHYKSGHNECGIGAIVPWAGKLWMVNYAPHQPKGSEHKLFSVDPDLTQPLTIHPESVGGTPAGRMIHEESNQLLIAHHLIDAEGNVRTISPNDMPMRVTAIARHLKDPENMVYYIDMEGSIWEANVHTLAVSRLFKKPVPGWHGKGGYTSQGRLVVSNNGELHVGDYGDVLVGGKARNEEERGVLAEYDGENWNIVERRQFTEVTGPRGITGGSDGDDPIWTMGWDRRSVRLKVLDQGKWHTYLLPKAAYCNDARHGWYTEWPRIREITDGRWMMDMHGMFYEFPKTFSSQNSAGIKPIGSHLRYVPDFCEWNGKLVLASDETSIQGNPLAGQPQSNLWFGEFDDLKSWGPASAYGGPWIEDSVAANTPSDPFLVSGFDRRVLHLAVGKLSPVTAQILRASDEQTIHGLPPELAKLPRVSIPRGNWREPAPGFEFNVDIAVNVYLAVDKRGDPKLPSSWRLTDLDVTWGSNHDDRVYVRQFSAGTVSIPANDIEHSKGAYGMPHLAFVQSPDGETVSITAEGLATVSEPATQEPKSETSTDPVVFTLQVDRDGNGEWTSLGEVRVGDDGYVAHPLPNDLDAVWLRLVTNRDCIATAFLHQTTSRFVDGASAENQALFAGLADVEDVNATSALIYPAQRNRNLRVIADDKIELEFTKEGFDFVATEPDTNLQRRLHVEPEFTVDDASVIVSHHGKKFRLPKGHVAYDRPFRSGSPRDLREVESERILANIHGTFYELPLVTNGAPPAWNQVRPVSSHSKQITDYCSWNGLLVLAGVKQDVSDDEHVFAAADGTASLWFGGVDDLWKLGKPVGQGGPWKDSDVQNGKPSDAYLMTGYDRKSLTLQHDRTEPVGFTIEVDINGDGLWCPLDHVEVKPSETLQYSFADGFSASWVRLVSDANCQATATFTYE